MHVSEKEGQGIIVKSNVQVTTFMALFLRVFEDDDGSLRKTAILSADLR